VPWQETMKTPIYNEDSTVPPGDPGLDLEEQAWRWLRLLTSGDAKEWDAERFRRWVRTSPAHQASYNEVKRRWDAIEASATALLRVHPEAATVRARAPRKPDLRRRAFLGTAIGAAAAAGVAVVYPPFGMWSAPSEWGADYHTATGEQRTLALADRVDVTLNTRTSVRRTLVSGEMVGLDLIAGEAAVDLKGAGHPFAVVAGAGRSSAQTGKFEVRSLDGKVCVTCIAGSVRLEHPAGDRMLQARQQAVYDAASVSGVAAIDPSVVSAWRSGMLVFNQVHLADALEEINRYRSGRVVLMNTALRDKAVSGRFAIASLDLALWQLQQAFDLSSRTLPGGLTILI
jgi:transmembrane sensor